MILKVPLAFFWNHIRENHSHLILLGGGAGIAYVDGKKWEIREAPKPIAETVANGTCTSLDDGKKQVKEALIELGMLEITDE